MEINDAIKFLESKISNPSIGLPKEIFLFASRITPMANVDLLIKDENGRTLLSWRDDIHGRGWHVPGGIIRYKEKMENRIKEVAKKEIGTIVKFEKTPLAINEIILEQDTRAHFISFLFKCHVSKSFIPENSGLKEKDPGFLKWHDKCPDNLIKVHDIYIKYI